MPAERHGGGPARGVPGRRSGGDWQRSMLAFIVLGGVFSEGVDLPDDLLSGAAIISTGIPMVNPAIGAAARTVRRRL